MTAATSMTGDPSAPPEVDAELVSPGTAEPPKPETQAPAKPKARSLWPFGAAALVLAAAIGGAYFGIAAFLKERTAPAKSEAADTAAGADRGTASGAPEPTVSATAVTAAPPAAAPDSGDAVSAAAPPAPAAEEPAPSIAAPASQPAAPPLAAADDPLAELQAAAEREAAEESDGANAAPAAPVAASPEPSGAVEAAPGDVAAELRALRALFESETGRLSAALDAERTRASAQAEELAALRDDLARRAAAPVAFAPQTPPAATPPRGEARATLVLFSLARAVESGRPYKSELARAEALAPDAPAIAHLRVDAAEGAPTLPALKSRFPADMRRALAADAGKGGGLIGRFSSGLAELVSVRPAGPVAGASPRAVLSRAEAALAGDDLNAALAELKALSGPAREAMAPFVADAARVAAARAALDELNVQLIEAAAG